MEASIDIGNTRIKVGIFKDDTLLASEITNENSLLDYLNNWQIQQIIISSVAGKGELISKIKKSYNNTLELNKNTPLPIAISYATLETLGIDRLASAVGALQMHNGPILIIDAGSCITCDLVDRENVFRGGSISPGLKMRLDAMHTFTRNLPLLELEIPEEGVPDSTKQAMLTGVISGTRHELIGFISHYRALYPEITVIICGGDAKYFDKMNELNTFALPNLVLVGLNAILRFNGEE